MTEFRRKQLRIKENILNMNLEDGTYEKKIFIQLLVLVTVPLMIMGVIMYHIYVSGEEERNKQRLDSYCEGAYKDFDYVFSSIREYYMEAIRSDEVKWLFDRTEPPYSEPVEVMKAQEILRGNSFMVKYIAGYQFVHVKNGWILGNYGMSGEDELRNREDMEAFIQEQKTIPLSVYWLNRTEVPSVYARMDKISRLLDTSGELFVIKNDSLSGNINYLLLVQLDLSGLKEMAESYQNMGYEALVLSDGKTLVETDPDFTGAFLSEHEETQKIYNSPSGERYYVSKMISPVNGMTFVAGYNLANARKGAYVYVLASMFFALGIVIFIVIARFMALKLSKPVADLQELVDRQNDRLKELFIRNVIKGGMEEEKIAEAMKQMEAEGFPLYRMLGILCKPLQRAETVLPEEIRNKLFLQPVIYQNILLLIIGDNDEISLDYKVAEIYREIKNYIEQDSGKYIACGISRSFTRLHHMRRAYDECSETLHNCRNLEEGYSSLVLYDDYGITDRKRNAYDITIENEFLQAVGGCNEKEAESLLAVLLERMEIKGGKGIDRNFYLTRLLTSILAIPYGKGMSLDEVYGENRYNLIGQAGQIYDKKKLTEFLSGEVIHPLIEALSDHSQSEISEIVKQVVRMIKDTRGSITLNECADQLNYHPNYIWKVLKNEKGVTFTELANAEKLELAKYLLLTTSYSVAEISEKLQYNNVQNFIRFFKSHVGNTPAAFKKEHKE